MSKYSIAVANSKHLAEWLNLPSVDINETAYDFILANVNNHLVLYRIHPSMAKLEIDFNAGKSRYRRLKGGSELLIKATGINKYKNLSIIDATAGLGRDAFVMACHGAKVTMVEQNKIVALLLQDALARLLAVEAMPLSLVIENSFMYLKQIEQCPDIIYLDPMYPEKKKSALVKKEMQILQALVADDVQSEQLLELALQKAKKRVVVKRPKIADPLGNIAPTYSLVGKGNRFDVYINNK